MSSGRRGLLTRKNCPSWLSTEEKFYWHGWREKSVVANIGHCWEWQGPMSVSGYGDMRVDKRLTRAHRVSYELHKGPIPNGLHVLHACDNRSCVNPDHLRTGTDADNTRDKMERGRWRGGKPRKGESNPASRLTAEEVQEIRDAYATGIFTQKMLAEVYGNSKSSIGLIVTHRRWT